MASPRRRQRGLTSVEYAIAGGLIVLMIIVAMAAFGDTLTSAFETLFS